MSIQDEGRISRGRFLGIGGMGAAALALGTSGALAGSGESAGYGELVPDPNGMLDLPPGFRYRVLSEEGSRLSNGAKVPGDPDGMAAFSGGRGKTVLVRNHEQEDGDPNPVPQKNPYDPATPGGTTAIVVDNESRRVIKDYVTSSGTLNNCAGGATPWGTWLTCEEDLTTGHGYVFEVDPADPESRLSRTPIRAMGFFSHEAVDIDPRTGVAYLTEDDFRGDIPDDPRDEVIADVPDTEGGRGSRVSFLYRYVPDVRPRKPGDLQKGGRLQVMTLEEFTSPNMDLANPGARFGVVWRNVNPEEPHESAERLGAARFNRLEGAYFAGGAFWFNDTQADGNRGEKRLGQIFRYRPATETLELFFEGSSLNEMESPDNIVVTPWGDLWFAEDDAIDNADTTNRLMGITPEGRVYEFARNRVQDPDEDPGVNSEFAGPTFSPGGRTFFVNVQNPGITYAIWGPFRRRSPGRQRRMAFAAPPQHLAPLISEGFAETARRNGMSDLEAAAYDRLGVDLA